MKKPNKKLLEKRIKEFYKKGESLGKISEKLGISLDWIKAVLSFERSKLEKSKLSKEEINQSEKISDLIAQIGKLNIDISDLRAENAGLHIKVEELERVRKERELYFKSMAEKNKQFKQNLIGFIMEN